MHPPGHTRCPRYARGAVGVVEAVRGADRLPDRATYGERVDPEPVYSVVFRVRRSVGAERRGHWTVALDLWESIPGGGMSHDHDHDHHHPRPASEVELRARALEALLAERGLVSTDAIDAVVELYENDVGPQNGAKVVARAWVDDAYRERLLDATPTPPSPSSGSRAPRATTWWWSANTPQVHNMIVCTLCSCYPWPVLGLPPTWYKSSPYRARAVSEPRAVLGEFGIELGDEVEIRVWDSSAEVRYLVLPMRPSGTEGWSEAELAEIVTRDCMIGTGAAGRARVGPRMSAGTPALATVDRELGDAAPLPRDNGELVFEEPWQGRALGMGVVALERSGATWPEFRRHLAAAIAARPEVEGESAATAYYACWLDALEAVLAERGELEESVGWPPCPPPPS